MGTEDTGQVWGQEEWQADIKLSSKGGYRQSVSTGQMTHQRTPNTPVTRETKQTETPTSRESTISYESEPTRPHSTNTTQKETPTTKEESTPSRPHTPLTSHSAQKQLFKFFMEWRGQAG